MTQKTFVFVLNAHPPLGLWIKPNVQVYLTYLNPLNALNSLLDFGSSVLWSDFFSLYCIFTWGKLLQIRTTLLALESSHLGGILIFHRYSLLPSSIRHWDCLNSNLLVSFLFLFFQRLKFLPCSTCLNPTWRTTLAEVVGPVNDSANLKEVKTGLPAF